jgi:aminoglycoside phosphotransferase (APT) family kinase protein
MLETPARKYVLRRKPPGKLLPVRARGRPRVQGDQRALRARLPGRRPVIYCADESITGTAFYVMGFVDGRVIWEPEMPDSNPAERSRRIDVMNATLARLHCVRAVGDRPCDYGKARTTSRARSTAGRSSTAPPRPRRSTRWSA